MYTQKVVYIRSDGKKFVEADWKQADRTGGKVPTVDIANGSEGIEIDTAKGFKFDEDGGAWVEV